MRPSLTPHSHYYGARCLRVGARVLRCGVCCVPFRVGCRSVPGVVPAPLRMLRHPASSVRRMTQHPPLHRHDTLHYSDTRHSTTRSRHLHYGHTNPHTPTPPPLRGGNTPFVVSAVCDRIHTACFQLLLRCRIGFWVGVALSAHGWTRQRSSSALWLLDICYSKPNAAPSKQE